VETPAPAATPVVPTPAVPAVTTPVTETPAAPAAPVEQPTPAVTPETPKVEEPAAPAAKPETPAVAVIPETYELKLPNGVQIDPAFIPALTPALKKAGLTQQQLQTVAESYLEFQAKIPARMLERDLDITMKDPEVGGLNYGRTQGHVNAALGAFTHPEFRSLLAKTGLANNLEFVRVFERIGKAMAGDTAARGTPDGAPQLSRAERMYGKTAPHT
jgi:hypothetical protein